MTNDDDIPNNDIPFSSASGGESSLSSPETRQLPGNNINAGGAPVATADLPALRQIFDELKSGRHWAFGDDVYPELSGPNFDAYANWFSRIGIQLHRDHRGFCHATLDKDDDFPASNSPKTASGIVLFTAIWIEALADRGQNIHEEIFHKEHHVENLPHLATDSHRRLMTDAGLAAPEEFNRFLATLHRLGFTQLLPDNSFRVRAPFHRLLDICQEYGRLPSAPDSTPDSTSATSGTPDDPSTSTIPRQ